MPRRFAEVQRHHDMAFLVTSFDVPVRLGDSVHRVAGVDDGPQLPYWARCGGGVARTATRCVATWRPWGAHKWSTASSGAVYHALKAMTRQGLMLVHETTASTVGGPPRMEYELTEEGERTYLDLLREALSSPDPRLDLLAAAVGLIDDLPRAQAIELLRRRTKATDEWREGLAAHLPPDADLET
jgi:DNA-binding PadR family transcriptional regulator